MTDSGVDGTERVQDDPADVRLAVTVMRRLDQQDARLTELDDACQAMCEALHVISQNLRLACDGVADAAQAAETISRSLRH